MGLTVTEEKERPTFQSFSAKLRGHEHQARGDPRLDSIPGRADQLAPSSEPPRRRVGKEEDSTVEVLEHGCFPTGPKYPSIEYLGFLYWDW